MKMNILTKILRSHQTVFSFKELVLEWRNRSVKSLKDSITYYLSQGYLYPIKRGLYAKDINYNKFELATKIYTPSYISFETVLLKSGIIFQYYSQIFVASYQTREIICDGQTYAFKTIKREILTNSTGIRTEDNYAIASPERAFLDTIYIHKHYYFDNLSSIDWRLVYEILPIYNKKTMKKRVDSYRAEYIKRTS